MNPRMIAAEIKAARDRHEPLAPITSRVPGFDVANAYRVAAIVHEARVRDGERPVGRKIGFSNRDLWEPMHVDAPVWGHVYDTTVSFLAHTEGQFPLRALLEPRIEPEIVIKLRATPPAGATPQSLTGCIEWIAHGFEIVECPYPGWNFLGPDTIAACALHAALLIGPTRSLAELGPDLVRRISEFEITLSCNGALRDRGGGAKVLGSPLASLAHLVAVLALQPEAQSLAAGDLVTTGTLTGAPLIHAGERWTTEIAGLDLPGLALELTP